jgi:hypothetical protein
MVPLIIEYLHSRRQLLLRGERISGHFFGKNEGLWAPSLCDDPPTSTSFRESSSTERVRRSVPRAGLQVGDSHQPQMSDASILPQSLNGTCLWWRCWLSVSTQTPGSASRQTPKPMPRSRGVSGAPPDESPAPGTLSVLPLGSRCTGWRRGCTPGAPGYSKPQQGAGGPPTSRRTRSRTCSSNPERCPQDVSAGTTPVAQATYHAWIKGDGNCRNHQRYRLQQSL